MFLIFNMSDADKHVGDVECGVYLFQKGNLITLI